VFSAWGSRLYLARRSCGKRFAIREEKKSIEEVKDNDLNVAGSKFCLHFSEGILRTRDEVGEGTAPRPCRKKSEEGKNHCNLSRRLQLASALRKKKTPLQGEGQYSVREEITRKRVGGGVESWKKKKRGASSSSQGESPLKLVPPKRRGPLEYTSPLQGGKRNIVKRGRRCSPKRKAQCCRLWSSSADRRHRAGGRSCLHHN